MSPVRYHSVEEQRKAALVFCRETVEDEYRTKEQALKTALRYKMQTKEKVERVKFALNALSRGCWDFDDTDDEDILEGVLENGIMIMEETIKCLQKVLKEVKDAN